MPTIIGCLQAVIPVGLTTHKTPSVPVSGFSVADWNYFARLFYSYPHE